MTLTIAQIILLSSFSIVLAAGQILFKLSADSAPRLHRLADLPALATNLNLWAAIILYAAATLLWVYLLQRVPLSRAYPFVALSFVLVPLCAWLFFNETITLRYVTGAAFILVGIYLTGGSPR